MVLDLLAMLFLGAACAAAAAPTDPAALLKSIAADGRGERRASFVEIKTSALFAAPMQARGTLIFRPPDVLEKRTIAPEPERLRIEAGQLSIEGAPIRGQAQRRVLRLSDVPLLAPLVEGLRATLAGDLAALQTHYEVSLRHELGQPPRSPKEASLRLLRAWAAGDAWVLHLVPRDPALRATVQYLRIVGSGSEIGLIEIVEVGGDRSEMWLTSIR